MKFTHELDVKQGWVKKTYKQPKDFKKVEHLGKCDIDGDMFVAYDTNNYIYIFKGTLEDETLKKNTWYKSKSCDTLVYRTSDFDNYGIYYKFEDYDYRCTVSEVWTEATENEIKKALIQLAKEKGFKDIHKLRLKTIHNEVTHEGYWSFSSNFFEYNLQTNTLTLDAVPIFHNGKWAEILENEPNKSTDEKLESLLDRIKALEVQVKKMTTQF